MKKIFSFFFSIRFIQFLRKLEKTIKDYLLIYDHQAWSWERKKQIIVSRILSDLSGNDLIPFIDDKIVLEPLLNFLVEFIYKKITSKKEK